MDSGEIQGAFKEVSGGFQRSFQERRLFPEVSGSFQEFLIGFESVPRSFKTFQSILRAFKEVSEVVLQEFKSVSRRYRWFRYALVTP